MSKGRDRYGRAKETSEYAALQRIWYAKLAATGFEDIEPHPDRLTINSYLKEHWLDARKRAYRGVETGKAEMFRLAYRWLDVEHWRSRRRRWAFVMWTQGWSWTEIARRWPNLGVATNLANWGRSVMVRAFDAFKEEAAAESAAEEAQDLGA